MKKIQTDRSLEPHGLMKPLQPQWPLRCLPREGKEERLWSLLRFLGPSPALRDVCTTVGITRTAQGVQAPERFRCFRKKRPLFISKGTKSTASLGYPGAATAALIPGDLLVLPPASRPENPPGPATAGSISSTSCSPNLPWRVCEGQSSTNHSSSRSRGYELLLSLKTC